MTAKVGRIGDAGAELVIPKEVAERAGLKTGEELAIFAPAGGIVLLARETGKKGYFVGSVETLSVAEVFGFVCSAIRSGLLLVQTLGARRRVVFREGQVAFAASTEPSERLGPVLWREGLVTLEQLHECEPRVSPGQQLGKLLIDAGYLTPAQLYRGMQAHVREIVLCAFCETKGELAFVEGDTAEANALKLPERTRDLVLAGMARSEDLLRLRRRLDPAALVRRADGGSPAPADKRLAAVFDLVRVEKPAAEIVRASRLGELAGLKALLELIAQGLLAASASPAPPFTVSEDTGRHGPALDSGGPMQAYRDAIRLVWKEFKGAGAYAGRLNTFFKSLAGDHASVFEGVSLDDAGAVDVDLVLANAQKVQRGAMGRAMALEALDAFLSFALFDARNVLAVAKAHELQREVARLLRGK